MKSHKKLKKKPIEKSVLKPNKTNRYAWLVIFVLGFVLYSNSISNDYALDDAIVITKNQFTQKGLEGIGDIFSYDTFTGFWLSTYTNRTAKQIQDEKKLVAGGRYRPLSVATFAFEKQLFGQNPHISHFVNILLYILTCIVLYNVLSKLFRNYKSKFWYLSFPFIATLLFLAHPIHTEAVANIKGRDEIMTLLGSLLALWFTIKYFETGKIANVLWSSISLFLGLLSKENAITFLAVIPISMYYFYHNKNAGKKLYAYGGLLLAAGIFLLIRASVLGGGGEKQIAHEIMNNPFLDPISKEPVSFGVKMATIFVTLWMYIRLLIFPHPLTYDYYPYQIPLSDWSNPYTLIALVIYLSIGLYAIYGLFKRKDIFSYGILMFLIPLSVVSNVFFSVGTFMNERFIFISSIGFSIILAWVVYNYLPMLVKNKSKLHTVMLIVLLPILLLYSGKTMSRNKAWENDFVLFTTDVKVSFNSAKSTCSAGGKLIEESQKPVIKSDTALHNKYVRDAIGYLEKSLEIHPEYVDALNLLGNAWYELEMNTAKSVHYYTEVLKLRPYHNVAYQNAGIVVNNGFAILNNGKNVSTYEEILTACIELDKVKPGIRGLNHLIGTIYGRYLNNLDSSILYLNKEIEGGNQSISLQKDIAVAYGMKGLYEQALFHFEKAIELDPNDPSTWINAAYTHAQMGNMPKYNEYIAKSNQLKSKNQQ